MKILLLRFSSIGDIVLTSPVIRCLKQQLNAEVHFLSKKAFQPVLEHNPYLSQTWFFEKNVREVLPALKAEQFDHVIDLHRNMRSFLVKCALKRPAVSFNKLNIEKWLLVNFKVNYLPDRHIVFRYLDAARHLGVTYDGQGLDYFLPPVKEELPVDIPRQPFTAFAIGATHATKRMPEDKIIELCSRIEHPIVLLGGKTEAAAGNRIAQQCPKVVDACGRLSLHQSAMVLQQAENVITHDTGMMHIAAALRKKIISLWGSTVPEFGMYPFLPNHFEPSLVVEVKGLPCRPCSKIGYPKCPKGHFRCMQDIDVQKILHGLE